MKWMQLLLNLVLVVALLVIVARQGWFDEYRQALFDDDPVGIVDDNRPLSG